MFDSIHRISCSPSVASYCIILFAVVLGIIFCVLVHKQSDDFFQFNVSVYFVRNCYDARRRPVCCSWSPLCFLAERHKMRQIQHSFSLFGSIVVHWRMCVHVFLLLRKNFASHSPTITTLSLVSLILFHDWHVRITHIALVLQLDKGTGI